MDSFLDKLFAWFRGPKEEEDAPLHEEHSPHESAEEKSAESEERFHDFEHERHAPYMAPEEDQEREEPDPATFAAAAGLKMKKEQEA